MANWPPNTSTGNKFEKAASWTNNVKAVSARISFLQQTIFQLTWYYRLYRDGRGMAPALKELIIQYEK